MPILIQISPGELLDKITILQIKSERIIDAAKLTNVRRELAMLEEVRGKTIADNPQIAQLTVELRQTNEALWQIEDELRACEQAGRFDERFIELARGVYHHNDRRSALKRRLNDLFGSPVVEEKSYSHYSSFMGGLPPEI